jgi:hypothetical protein
MNAESKGLATKSRTRAGREQSESRAKAEREKRSLHRVRSFPQHSALENKGRVVDDGSLRVDGRCLRLLADPLVQPEENLFMPLERVARLEHPVVLRGEEEEPRGDAPCLEGGEGGQAVLLAEPVVLAAVDRQLRGRPAADKVGRIPPAEG